MGVRPQGLPPAIQLREKDGMVMAPVPDRLTGDTHGRSDFTIGLTQDQEIDGVLLLGRQRFIDWWLCGFVRFCECHG
jgi:hypothetical protein